MRKAFQMFLTAYGMHRGIYRDPRTHWHHIHSILKSAYIEVGLGETSNKLEL